MSLLFGTIITQYLGHVTDVEVVDAGGAALMQEDGEFPMEDGDLLMID